MKNIQIKFLVFCIILLIPIGLTHSAESESKTSNKLKSQGNSPIVIFSDKMILDNKKRIVTFHGNVLAKEGDFSINCEKMLIYYIEESKGDSSETGDMNIDKIVVTGQVKISEPEMGIDARADKAEYFQTEEKLVLTGNPTVKRGNDLLEGSRITLFLGEERSLVEGSNEKKVKAILFPKGGKGLRP